MNRDIIVFDFETGGRNPMRCQPTQIAAIALDGRNLGWGEFNSMMRPIIDDEEALAAGVDPLEEGALKVTGRQDRSWLNRFLKVSGRSFATL